MATEKEVLEEQMKAELEKELQKVVSIVDDILEPTDQVMQNLSSLKELKQKLLNPESLSRSLPPPEFICPISRKLMNDPVLIASSQAYDRPFIQKWLENARETYPQTDQVLSHMILAPNQPLKEMISRWCKEHEVDLPSHLDRFISLPKELSSLKLSDQKMVVKEIRQLTASLISFQSLFEHTVSHLDEPLSSGKADFDPELQEDLVMTILVLAVYDSKNELLAKNAAVIPFLIESLKTGTTETRRNAAAALFSLSGSDSNKYIIGDLGLKLLIELLAEGDQQAMEDAASTIFRLCTVQENRSRAVSDGAVKVVMQKIKDHIFMDEFLAFLALLSSQQEVIEEMAKLGAVSLLLDVMRETTSDLNKEYCITILYAIFFYHPEILGEIRNEEDANGPISQIAQIGTPGAKKKANIFLKQLKR